MGLQNYYSMRYKGIIYNFEIYSGKINPTVGYPDLGPSSNIVLHLTQIVEKNANFLLYFNNWFSSARLLAELGKECIFTLGTAKINRFPGCKFSTEKEMEKKRKGNSRGKEILF